MNNVVDLFPGRIERLTPAWRRALEDEHKEIHKTIAPMFKRAFEISRILQSREPERVVVIEKDKK